MPYGRGIAASSGERGSLNVALVAVATFAVVVTNERGSSIM